MVVKAVLLPWERLQSTLSEHQSLLRTSSPPLDLQSPHVTVSRVGSANAMDVAVPWEEMVNFVDSLNTV